MMISQSVSWECSQRSTKGGRSWHVHQAQIHPSIEKADTQAQQSQFNFRYTCRQQKAVQHGQNPGTPHRSEWKATSDFPKPNNLYMPKAECKNEEVKSPVYPKHLELICCRKCAIQINVPWLANLKYTEPFYVFKA